MSSSFRKRLLDAATAPYRQAGHFAWHFARGKLGRDPVFFSLLASGAFPAEVRMVDLGCGQALLSNWLTAARQLHASGDWAGDWPAPPRVGLPRHRTDAQGCGARPSDTAAACRRRAG